MAKHKQDDWSVLVRGLAILGVLGLLATYVLTAPQNVIDFVRPVFWFLISVAAIDWVAGWLVEKK